MSRLENVPFVAQRTVQVDAKVYNLWRRAKRRLQMPVRFPLVNYSGFEMIIDSDEWLCVDGRQNDLPILAWVEFEGEGRDALHTPVNCKLNYYHFAASKVRAHSLELVEEELERRLHEK